MFQYGNTIVCPLLCKKIKTKLCYFVCFSKNTKFVYTIFSREIINLIIEKLLYVFLLQNYEIFLYEI